MKKTTGKTAGALALLTVLTWPALSGCGGGGGGDSAPAPPIVGTFRESSISGNSQSITCPGTLTLPGGTTDSCGANDTVQFRQDGTFTVTSGGVSFSGTYQYNGATLSLNITAPASVAGRTVAGPATLTNNNNTFSLVGASAADTTDVYTRQ